MNAVKVEVQEDYLSCNKYCYFCLQPLPAPNQSQFNSLAYLLSYLKIRDEIKETFLCQGCVQLLIKFEKLANIMEKVRLELDYLLGSIENSISSSQDCIELPLSVYSVRKLIAKKCKDQVKCSKALIILEKLDISNLIKTDAPTLDFVNDLDDDSNSSSSFSDNELFPPTLIKAVEDHCKVVAKPQTLKTQLKCSKCPRTFTTRQNLNVHTDQVHFNIARFQCPTCLKLFSSQHGLRQHIDAIHLNLKQYKCDVCDKSYTHPRSLQRHKASPHKPKVERDPNSKTFSCKICSKTFHKFKVLRDHKRNVHGKRRFPCQICKKLFKTGTDLTRHVSGVHEKRTCYYCKAEGCDKNYVYKQSLLEHYKSKHPEFIQKPNWLFGNKN